LLNIKLFISGSCSILVLPTVLSRPRRNDAKMMLKDIMGQPLTGKMRFENSKISDTLLNISVIMA
jgi:hypothetical protein